MFQGMTAFLEAIDEKVEQHAHDNIAKVESNAKIFEKSDANSLRNKKNAHEIKFDCHRLGELEDKCPDNVPKEQHHPVCITMPQVKENGIFLPKFPLQPPMQCEQKGVGHLYRTVESPEKVTTALTIEKDVELSSLLRQKEEEIDALKQDVRRHQAIGEAARKELLQRSLQLHQLEEELRCTKSYFDEHKAKSRCLLDETQRQCDALRRRMETHNEDNNHIYCKNCVKSEGNNSDKNAENAALQERLEEMELVTASVKQKHEQLQSQMAACRREISVAQEEKHELAQQLEFVRLDLRGAQEALDSELAAHRESKAFLHRCQQELNELRAAVEKNGGIFTSTGELISLRSNDLDLRDQLLMSRQLLEKQNALEAALREATEWRRRCERITHRLDEERTTRVNVALSSSSLHASRETAEFRPKFLKRSLSTNAACLLAIQLFAAVDTVALRFGRLLQRQTVLRIVTALYIFCLHVWLMTVLCIMSAATVK